MPHDPSQPARSPVDRCRWIAIGGCATIHPTRSLTLGDRHVPHDPRPSRRRADRGRRREAGPRREGAAADRLRFLGDLPRAAGRAPGDGALRRAGGSARRDLGRARDVGQRPVPDRARRDLGRAAGRAARRPARRGGPPQGRGRAARPDRQPASDAVGRPALRVLLRGSAAHRPHRHGVRARPAVRRGGGDGEALRRQRLRDRAHDRRRPGGRADVAGALSRSVRGDRPGRAAVAGDGGLQRRERPDHDGEPAAGRPTEVGMGLRRRGRVRLDGDPQHRGVRPGRARPGDARPARALGRRPRRRGARRCGARGRDRREAPPRAAARGAGRGARGNRGRGPGATRAACRRRPGGPAPRGRGPGDGAGAQRGRGAPARPRGGEPGRRTRTERRGGPDPGRRQRVGEPGAGGDPARRPPGRARAGGRGDPCRGGARRTQASTGVARVDPRPGDRRAGPAGTPRRRRRRRAGGRAPAVRTPALDR